MCYDVSLRHRIRKTEIEAEIAKLEQERPDDWYATEQFNILKSELRIAEMHIKRYDRMIKMGVKF